MRCALRARTRRLFSRGGGGAKPSQKSSTPTKRHDPHFLTGAPARLAGHLSLRNPVVGLQAPLVSTCGSWATEYSPGSGLPPVSQVDPRRQARGVGRIATLSSHYLGRAPTIVGGRGFRSRQNGWPAASRNTRPGRAVPQVKHRYPLPGPGLPEGLPHTFARASGRRAQIKMASRNTPRVPLQGPAVLPLVAARV